ncbi:hypothetical protein RFI_07445, partial [Reticulomyxa filosa]
VSLLKELEHPCIVELERSLYIDGDLYLVFAFMDNDLKQYLDNSEKNLEMSLVKSYAFLLIEGVRHCHSRRVLHRDLKPQNILISKEGDLKIADFGLGREHGLPIGKLTHEVVTLWYRPPEILLGQEKYSGAADIWGVGCIIAEIATRRALFPGDSEIDQLFQIFKILGTPNEDVWPGVSRLENYKQHFPCWKPQSLSNVLQNSNLGQDGIDLIEKMLTYPPNKRITAKEALLHPWFDDVRTTILEKLEKRQSLHLINTSYGSKENLKVHGRHEHRNTPMDFE